MGIYIFIRSIWGIEKNNTLLVINLCIKIKDIPFYGIVSFIFALYFDRFYLILIRTLLHQPPVLLSISRITLRWPSIWYFILNEFGLSDEPKYTGSIFTVTF